jgi:hypothetical protein
MRRARGEVIGRAVLPTARGRVPRWMRRWWRSVRARLAPHTPDVVRVTRAPAPAAVEARGDLHRDHIQAVEPTGECVAVVDMGQLDVTWRIANVRV